MYQMKKIDILNESQTFQSRERHRPQTLSWPKEMWWISQARKITIHNCRKSESIQWMFFVLWLQFIEETSAHDCYSGGAWNLSQAITQHMRPGWAQDAQLFCNVKLTWRGQNKMRCSCTFDIPRTEQDMALQVQSNVCSIQVGKRSFSGGKERREGGLTPA